MIIYCDMDGVLARFVDGIKEVLGNNGVPVPAKMSKWKLEANVHPFWRKKARKLINKALCHTEVWSLLLPHEGALEGFKALQDLGDVYIATTPWNSIACFEGKRQWIRKYLPYFPLDKVIFIKNKSLLQGEILIDDKPGNLNTFDARTILVNREWNQEDKKHLRAYTWEDILAYCRI